TPWSTRSEATKPSPSVFSPTSRPSRFTTQFTAPSAAATGDSSSTAAAAASLCGIVTDIPLMPRGTIDRTAASPCSGATSNAQNTQSSCRAAKAALWSAGESEWRTGWPMTAATWVAADTSRGVVIGCSEDPRGAGLVAHPEELVVVVGEEVAAVGVGEDVVEPRALGGMERGLERTATRHRDGGGRQAGVEARVVGRVEGEVGVGERPGALGATGVDDRGVDAEVHAELEPVVDDPRHEGVLLGEPGLLLDHRRDDDVLVGGEAVLLERGRIDVHERVEADRAGHGVELAVHALEDLELGVGDPVLVGVGEEEALPALDARGPPRRGHPDERARHLVGIEALDLLLEARRDLVDGETLRDREAVEALGGRSGFEGGDRIVEARVAHHRVFAGLERVDAPPAQVVAEHGGVGDDPLLGEEVDDVVDRGTRGDDHREGLARPSGRVDLTLEPR